MQPLAYHHNSGCTLHFGECLQLIAGTDGGGRRSVAFSERLHLVALHLANIDCIYQDTVRTIHTVVTAAYLLARYIFVNGYDDEMYLMRINTSLLPSSQNA